MSEPDIISLAELRRNLGWTLELDALASLAAARGLLGQIHNRALALWFASTQGSSLSSCTAVVVGSVSWWAMGGATLVGMLIAFAVLYGAP